MLSAIKCFSINMEHKKGFEKISNLLYEYMQPYLADASAKIFSIVCPQNFKMHIGIPPIFCKFQFSSQAIDSTLLEKNKKENWLKTSKWVIVTTFSFLKAPMHQLCRIDR